MKKASTSNWIFWGLLGLCSPWLAQAQPVAPETAPTHEVGLRAVAEASVTQDWLEMRFAIKLQADNAADLQLRMKKMVAEALETLKPLEQGESLQVRSNGFNLNPRYNYKEEGKLEGWNGYAGIVIEGRDFARIGKASEQMGRWLVEGVDFRTSSALTRATADKLRLQAIAAFREQATSVTHAFGFKDYTLIFADVGSGQLDNNNRRSPVFARSLAVSDAAAVPVSAGQQQVRVSVSGRIRLQ